jgi:hypothetical protein
LFHQFLLLLSEAAITNVNNDVCVVRPP